MAMELSVQTGWMWWLPPQRTSSKAGPRKSRANAYTHTLKESPGFLRGEGQTSLYFEVAT